MRWSPSVALVPALFAQFAAAAPIQFARTTSAWLVERDDQLRQCTMTTKTGNSLVSLLADRAGATALMVKNNQWRGIDHAATYLLEFDFGTKRQLRVRGYNQNGTSGIGVELARPLLEEMLSSSRMLVRYGTTKVLDFPLLEVVEGERLLRQCARQLG